MDPVAIQEIFTLKQHCINKDFCGELMFQDLLGESFLFSPTNEAWKAKRKACAHAFYKERLVIMMGTLQNTIMKYIN
jgi:hypothetical protein